MVCAWLGYGGGTGKTTLATSVYMEIRRQFQGHSCIVENIREESNKNTLTKLQETMLSAVFKGVTVRNVVEGKQMIKTMLLNIKVLIVLDDVNHLDQLEVLAGSHSWFGSGSRIIITTRDEHLLRTHRVDEVYHARLLSDDEAMQLFNQHAYNEKIHIEDYKTLSLRVVRYADGLPLALKVLGSFLYDKEKKMWMDTLDILKDNLELQIVEKLKISYDELTKMEKGLFLDIACFWRKSMKYQAMEVLEACGFYPEIGIEVLRQKALIYVDKNGLLDMHDLVQEMGHYIAREEHSNNPENHSRLWKRKEIDSMCLTTKNDKIEAIEYDDYIEHFKYGDSSKFFKSVSYMKKLRYLNVRMKPKHDEELNFLSNELRYIEWDRFRVVSPFAESFKPMNLVVLKLSWSRQTELWKGCKYLPHLKVLKLEHMMNLLSTPEFDGLSCLQELTLIACDELEEIHPSLRKHRSLQQVYVHACYNFRIYPKIGHMENLKTLELRGCHHLQCIKQPFGIVESSNLQELSLAWNSTFSRIAFSLVQFTQLKLLNLCWCEKLLELPELPSSLLILNADDCSSLTTFGDCHKNCTGLCQVSIKGGSIINDGKRLLASMLKVCTSKENCPICLHLEGAEVTKRLACLYGGGRCRLQLPGNWCKDFSGFLMCGVFIRDSTSCYHNGSTLRMSQVMSGIDSKDDVVWVKSDGDNYRTRVWYVPFGSLRHTTWWDKTYKSLVFSLGFGWHDCCAFGVSLVGMKSGSGLTETSTYSSTKYTPQIKIDHDDSSGLSISLYTYDENNN